MILKGSQRAGASALAGHLLNVVENEHVSVHELRGFVSDTLQGAFNEIYAISKGTRCNQFMFSLILSPPENENVSIETFELERDKIEERLGLVGQPRALVFHEKKGRRHAHCVWSRIDADQMKAINLPHFKLKLKSLSREIYLKHGWDMPPGLKHADERDPLNYSQVEHSQAKRSAKDVRHLKQVFQTCWASSDSQTAFANALLEHGLYLARGTQRGHVAVDNSGEIYSISRWVGVKAKDVRAKFGNGGDLPGVEVVLQQIAKSKTTQTNATHSEINALFRQQRKALEVTRTALVLNHRHARENLKQEHSARQIAETKIRNQNFPTGLKAAWFRLSGQYAKFRQTYELETKGCDDRDQAEFQRLIEAQLSERQELENEFRQLRKQRLGAMPTPSAETTEFVDPANKPTIQGFDASYDPAQPLHLPDETQRLFTTQQINKRPERVLEVITDKNEEFSRSDIIRELAKDIKDPLRLSSAANAVLQTKTIVKIKSGAKPLFSTLEFQDLKSSMLTEARAMASQQGFRVSSKNTRDAIRKQNAELNKLHGAQLSNEQTAAIKHILGQHRMCNVVGLAGSGKSTMLSAAHDAWTRQGYNVRGAALSGKAADGLQEASGIESRTLASLEHSWKNGFGLLEPNDVLVMDEAGMIGTRQLQHIIKEAAIRGAKLVLVGDPEQLQPINAGTPFRNIMDQIDGAKLTEIHRQSEEWQKQASLDFAENRTDAALKAYADHGVVETSANTSDAISKLVQDYMIDLEIRGTECSRLALAYRRKDVHAINQGIRMARKLGGELSDEMLFKTKHGPRAFAARDRILFTKNDHELGVRNGSQGVVENVTGNMISVRFDGTDAKTQRRITFSPIRYNAIDHGYASTIHKSQGATVDHTFILGSRQMDRHLTYVAMTRHRNSVKLYEDYSSPLRIHQGSPQQSKRSGKWCYKR